MGKVSKEPISNTMLEMLIKVSNCVFIQVETECRQLSKMLWRMRGEVQIGLSTCLDGNGEKPR
jgi:hypothetical protein